MFKVNNKDTTATPMASFWCLYCYLSTYFTSCSSVSIVNFELVKAGWVNPCQCINHLRNVIVTEMSNGRKTDWKIRTKHDGFCLPCNGQIPNLRILGIRKFQKNYWKAWNWWKVPSRPPKSQISTAGLVIVKMLL